MLKKLQISLLSILLLLTFTLNISADENDIIPLDNLDIGSEVYLLMDRESKQILSEKNSQELVHPASITKVLTVITTIEMMEPLNLKQEINIDPAVYQDIDPEASIVGFMINEKVTLEDILQGIMLPSGADATRAISYHLFQDTEELALAMNTKAQEIGMKNSNFVNTSGLDDDKHLSTAYDLALLVDYALENEVFRKLYESKEYTTSKTTQHPEGIELIDRNLEYAESLDNNYIVGAKSGYTDAAQRALSSVATNGEKEYIFISVLNENILSKKGPIDDANLAYNRIYNEYKQITAINTEMVIDTLLVEDALDYEYQLAEDVRIYIPKELNTSDLKIEIKDKPEGLKAPVEAKSNLGILEISYNDKIVYRQTLLNEATIPVKLSKVILDFMISLAIILVILLIVISIFILIWRSIIKRRRKRRYY